jgi:hypothetical protein
MFLPLSNRNVHTVHDSPILTVKQVNCKAQCAFVVTIWPDIPRAVSVVSTVTVLKLKTAFLTLTTEQLYPGTKQGKNFVLHSLSTKTDILIL